MSRPTRVSREASHQTLMLSCITSYMSPGSDTLPILLLSPSTMTGFPCGSLAEGVPEQGLEAFLGEVLGEPQFAEGGAAVTGEPFQVDHRKIVAP